MESPGTLLKRIEEIPGYTWSTETEPFHSSYDNWHFYGTQHAPEDLLFTSPPASTRASTKRPSYDADVRPPLKAHKSSTSESKISGPPTPVERKPRKVVARVSTHILRLEREFQISKHVVSQSDPDFRHFVRPIELVRLPARQGQEAMIVSIFEAPGANYLREIVELGPNSYRGVAKKDNWDFELLRVKSNGEIPLLQFLDFAVGATECCEVLHHSERQTVHGELRGDAFHFNKETGAVKMINFGSGARAFENGLTSSGWYSLSREVGVEHKLQFIAPEQTGRLPAEPDSRTDIYSLGVLFWMMLTGERAFEGDEPLVIMQNVLSRRIPSAASKRLDIPQVLSDVIQKMTQKNIDDRYNSTSGLKYDLMEIRNMLNVGDGEGLKSFKLCTKDVSAFFNLPTKQIGRVKEKELLVSIINEVAKRRYKSSAHGQRLYTMGSSSASSDNRQDTLLLDDAPSDSTSSKGSESKFSNGVRLPDSQHSSQENIGHTSQSPSNEGPMNPKRVSSSDARNSKPSSSSNSSNFDTTAKFLRDATTMGKKGRCEVISISGSTGIGKSALIQSVQPTARSRGYFASAKFYQARRSPFEPVLRLMSSLFRQIFSESDISTDYHNHIRTYIRPLWHILHLYLDLPETFLDSSHTPKNTLAVPSGMPQGPNAAHGSRRASSPALSSRSLNSALSTTDWLRTSGSTKSSRFINIFLGALRVLSSRKFICLAIEDLQFADNESLDLISKIVTGKVPILLVVTFREESSLPKSVVPLLNSATKIELKPFTESETSQYVATTLHRNRDADAYLLPLVAVIQERTAGNPFFVREMLDSCYRKSCVYYNWKDSAWQFDLDKVFTEFESQTYGEITNDFVTKRLQELPSNARALLAWASLLGSTFSFTLVKHLQVRLKSSPHRKSVPSTKNKQDLVAGLQNALSAYILMDCGEEDRFRFSHARYMQAASSLVESYDKKEMHFAIARVMIMENFHDFGTSKANTLYVKAAHICLAVDLIRERENIRNPYRDLLSQAAENASESGGRSTALYYWCHCLTLLPDDPWNEQDPDVNYQETLTTYTRSAEAYWHQRDFENAMNCLNEVFKHAKSPIDMAPGWIIKSRVFAVQGNSSDAFDALKDGLMKLGVILPDTTFQACDDQFERTRRLLQATNYDELLARPTRVDANLEAIGPVLLEMVSAAFWTNSLLFYQVSLIMIDTHFRLGEYRQVGLAYLHYATIAVGRFNLTQFGCEIGDVAQRLFDKHRDDPYTVGRGETLRALFLGHLQTPLVDQIPVLERAQDASILAGDRILSILNLGISAAYKLWSSHDLSEVENFCHDAPLEFSGWEEDLRGGVFLTSVRQYTRAMQGKTDYNDPALMMDSDDFKLTEYIEFVKSRASNAKRPLTLLCSYRMVGLFRFGHIKDAIETGEQLVEMSESVFCMRYRYSNLLYLCLSYCDYLRDNPSDPTRDAILKRIDTYTIKIQSAAAVNNVNYQAWFLLLKAELQDLRGNYGTAVASYEQALDHCELHGFILDEALIYELYAQALIRRGATRPARQLLTECSASYRRIGAYGKAEHVCAKFEWLIKGTTSLNTVEVACQTEVIDTGNTSYKLEQNEDRATHTFGAETTADRTQAWVEPSGPRRHGSIIDANLDGLPLLGTSKDADREVSAMGLDMIDLASILESSQVLSSELRVSKLMAKMTEIMSELTGAELAAIVIKGEQVDWNLAAAATPDGITSYPDGTTFESVANASGRQITTYVLRFREPVFLDNVLEDERFSNVSDTFMEETPEGRSVICLPILRGEKLLGSIYIEGPPNSFTDRNLTVLRLLVDQISISLANALFLKQIEKVSSENAAMITMQKAHLEKLQISESRAKDAEAIAIKNMQLKEEAAKAKSMFLANVSHELRTPLNGVIGMSELLKASRLTQDQEGYADSIRVCADTLLSVINDLLDFTKLEAGKMNMSSLPMNLPDTIREVVRALSYQNTEKGLQTIVSLDDLDNHQVVLGDPLRIHQILLNLLSNAYKFTNNGSVTVRAHTNIESKKYVEVTISVTDTGVGIKEEERLKLFQPFSQVESTSSRSFQGTGLGLSICKSLVERMGGKVWLESTPGVGTRVSFHLKFQKVTKEEAVHLMAAANETDLTAQISSSRGADGNLHAVVDLSKIPRDQLRICIAEDNAINQKIAISFVQKLGFKCAAFGDGRKAIDALEIASAEGRPYHLVLMDVQMPNLDGYDATREIRKHHNPVIRDVLIIAMTASAIQGDREKCLEAGMNNYLAKPVRVHTLKTLLETYLAQPQKKIPHLQEQANKLAIKVITAAQDEA